jgi:hypothetical protein
LSPLFTLLGTQVFDLIVAGAAVGARAAGPSHGAHGMGARARELANAALAEVLAQAHDHSEIESYIHLQTLSIENRRGYELC